MKERGRFLYKSAEGVIFIKFEHPGKGVPIESLLPENGRGDGFADFRITDYFDLADLVLAAPSEWVEFCRTVDLSGATKDRPKKVSAPPPNLAFLKLRDEAGMNPERASALFTVVAAYWSAPQNTIALEPGLVAALWHSGMTPEAIISYIRRFNNANGKLDLAGFKDDRGFQILHTVIQTYKAIKGYEDDTVLMQPEIETLLKTWQARTRSAQLGTTEMANTVLHWADYRRLCLVDVDHRTNVENVRKLAEFVFSSDSSPDFEDVATWADANLKSDRPKLAKTNTAAQALLKKKRKQGKLNRKRGRR